MYACMHGCSMSFFQRDALQLTAHHFSQGRTKSACALAQQAAAWGEIRAAVATIRPHRPSHNVL